MALHSAEELNKLYDTAYMDLITCNDSLAGKALASAIDDLFPEVISVADLGCANGVFMQHFSELDINVKGFDISQAARERALMAAECIEICDLRKPRDFGDEFDLAIAIEFLEHVELEAIDQVIENMRTMAPLIIATPGYQAGTGHFNVQPVDWWIKKFVEHGFVYDDEMSGRLDEFLKRPMWDRHQARFPYMRRGIMVYNRHPAVADVQEDVTEL